MERIRNERELQETKQKLLEFSRELFIHRLSIDTRVDWERGKSDRGFLERQPVLELKDIPPEPQPSSHNTNVSSLDRLIASRNQKKRDAWREYRDRIATENAAIQAEYEHELQEWEQRREEFLSEQARANAEVDRLRETYETGEEDGVRGYCALVLAGWENVHELQLSVDYDGRKKTLVVDQFLDDDVYLMRGLSSITKRRIDAFDEQFAYDSYYRALAAIRDLYVADTVEALQRVVFNAWMSTLDQGTGQEVAACLLSLSARRDEFLAIDLSRVDARACFEHLRGSIAAKPYTLKPVAPILTIHRESRRFVSTDGEEWLGLPSNQQRLYVTLDREMVLGAPQGHKVGGEDPSSQSRQVTPDTGEGEQPEHASHSLTRTEEIESDLAEPEGKEQLLDEVNMARFVGGPDQTPVLSPEDTKQFLWDPELHWKTGRSAYELATSWVLAGDIPHQVRSVLDQCEVYRDCQLNLGHFEKKISLRTPGQGSQTDLMLHIRLSSGVPAIVGVEGKVSETFGRRIAEWNDGTPTKLKRLERLCEDLGLDPTTVGSLRYQLLHRIASVLYEAEENECQEALMLVHSFSPKQAGFADFQAFANALGLSCEVGDISDPIRRLGVNLRLGWVSDLPLVARTA